jgi:hypothetical protein
MAEERTLRSEHVLTVTWGAERTFEAPIPARAALRAAVLRPSGVWDLLCVSGV